MASKKQQTVDRSWGYLGYAAVAGAITYTTSLWAIDSGSLLVYVMVFVAFYYVLHFLRLFIKTKFFNNDKTKSTKRTKS